ncbi:ROK family protein [Ruania zhangjianzhongii]|uniref:ROK family protein n=1 Tax=Ruania zhangjianzhongii TaxID=2603206 RepID=UPI0011C8B510|nr:ROK family protein [Ruania zhangjianzhongii]
MAAPALGVDIGGTAIKIGRVAADGTLSDARQVPTPRDPEVLADLIVAEAAATPAEAIGVVSPGIVDEQQGVVVFSANLGWRDLPLRQLLSARLAAPVVTGHDVRAGALAESRWGAGEPDLLFLPLGTGLASALITGGRIRGTGWAGEIGQILVPDPDGTGRVPLERICAAGALARRYAAATGTTDTSGGARAVFARAAAGDRSAQQVLDSAIETLADLLAATAGLLGPVPLVLGGGLAEAGDALLDPLRAALAARLPVDAMPPLRRARLGQWAGCLGAAALAMTPGGSP